MRKLFESMNESEFSELFAKMDYGLGKFQTKKRTEIHD